MASEAARAGALPRLVELSDLCGNLHAHTKATDGHHTLKEMAHAALARGLSYLGITEHSRHLTVAHGLDLLDTYCQMAKEEGVLVSINSDAHSIDDFDNLRYGVGQARRGWLEKQDVLNTRSLKELRVLLDHTM